jgi:hypothetical protein
VILKKVIHKSLVPPGSRYWRSWCRLRFLATPTSRRISIKIDTDGRYLTYILYSLHCLGYAVQVFSSPWVYRELISLSWVAPLAFVIRSGCPDPQILLITDDPLCGADFPIGQRILLDADYFNERKRGLPKMPYFVHPYALHRESRATPRAADVRPVRLGFFGSHDIDFYSRSFHFPILPRGDIIEALIGNFSTDISHVVGSPDRWGSLRIALAIDRGGGDNKDKQFLAPSDYFAGLRACDYFLCPPGWCMPISHNLIEAMQCGAIPILNYPQILTPPLQHGENCLAFSNIDEFKQLVRLALAMPQEQIVKMRAAVLTYFDQYLAPGTWLEACLHMRPPVVLVNNEEISVAMRWDLASGKRQ